MVEVRAHRRRRARISSSDARPSRGYEAGRGRGTAGNATGSHGAYARSSADVTRGIEGNMMYRVEFTVGLHDHGRLGRTPSRAHRSDCRHRRRRERSLLVCCTHGRTVGIDIPWLITISVYAKPMNPALFPKLAYSDWSTLDGGRDSCLTPSFSYQRRAALQDCIHRLLFPLDE